MSGLLEADARRASLLAGGGVLASVALVAGATHSPAAVAAFTGGVVALGLGLRAALVRRPAAQSAELATPDWSVTVAAIDEAEGAMAITDRAGRLVCANTAYQQEFSAMHAPPQLPLAEPARAALAEIPRAAWRDGSAEIARLVAGKNERAWRCSALRAGRADDFLIWRFAPIATPDSLAELSAQLGAPLGRALADAGFAVAIVDAEGVIRAASEAFALAAAGNAETALAGHQFVATVAQDEHERIYWARDTRRLQPLVMYYLPAADGLALMLLIDAAVGMGGGEGPATAPHIEALLAQLPLGLAMADRDGRLLFANPAFMRAAGREGMEPPTYPTDFVIREDKAAISESIRRFAQTPGTTGDIAVRLAHQPEDPVTLSLAGVRGLGDAAVLLGLTDTTEETRLKRQVAQATKMQAVGQLAGGVAHDFNNVLTAILGTCDLMLLRHTPGNSDYDDIQQIRASANRAASLTRQLLAFSRQQTLRPQVVQLPDIIAEVTQMLRRLIGEKIALTVTHDRDLAPVRADPTQLEQVIVNLAVNARDAIQENLRRPTGNGAARLTLATRRVTSAQVRALRSEIMPIGDYTALVIEDTGGGIPPEIIGKIWEPFFTTKEPGRAGAIGGTGLGLATVYGIVKQSGGFIFAENYGPGGRPGAGGQAVGARFSIYLPANQGAAAPGPKPSEPPTAWAGGGEILLVEDEDAVRAVAERALTRAGYTVTTARDGDEGLAMVEARLGQGGAMFALVISDVVMPVMDGPAMVRAMRQRGAGDAPVVFMSGYAEEQLRREIDVAGMHFLPKPFSVQQIVAKVGEVLAAKPG